MCEIITHNGLAGDLKAYMYIATGKTGHGEIVVGNNWVGFGKYSFEFHGFTLGKRGQSMITGLYS